MKTVSEFTNFKNSENDCTKGYSQKRSVGTKKKRILKPYFSWVFRLSPLFKRRSLLEQKGADNRERSGEGVRVSLAVFES